EAQPGEARERLLDERLVFARDGEGAKGERLDIGPGPQERQCLLLDSFAVAKRRESVESRGDRGWAEKEAIPRPRSQQPLDDVQIAAKEGQPKTGPGEPGAAVLHAALVGGTLESRRLVFVAGLDVRHCTDEQIAWVPAAGCGQVGGDRLLDLGGRAA